MEKIMTASERKKLRKKRKARLEKGE